MYLCIYVIAGEEGMAAIWKVYLCICEYTNIDIYE